MNWKSKHLNPTRKRWRTDTLKPVARLRRWGGGDMEKMREVLEFYAHTDQDEQAKQVLEEIDK